MFNISSISIWKKGSNFGIFATLFCFTVYALSLLHAKPLTNDTAPNILPVTNTKTSTKQTTTPTTTIPPHTTVQGGCEYEGNFYSPGDSFGEGSDGEGWCYGLYCDDDGDVIPWDDFNCGTTSTPLPTTSKTTILRTTTPRTTTLRTTTARTTTPRITMPRTTTPRTTTPRTRTPLTTFPPPTTTPRPLGCEVDGKFYSPGEEISSEIDKEAGWCYGTYCGENGNVIPWDDFNCDTSSTPLPSTTAPFPTTPKTTTSRTTTPRTSTPLTTFPTPTTTPRPLGCEVDGKFYSPGEEISSEIDKEIGWCYGTYCSEDGKVIPWDDFNCGTSTPLPSITAPFPTTAKTTTPRTTTPRTSTPLTTFPTPTTTPRPLGCEVDGKFYSPREEISSEIDKEIGWCYGTYCSEDGKVIPWDDFNCGTSTPLPSITAPFPTTLKTTTPRTTTPRTSTPLTTFPTPTTTPRPLGCEVDGKFYSPGEEISSEIDKEIGWCYGTYCSEDGKVIPWDDFNCGSSTPLPSITAPFPTTPKTTTPRTTTPRTSTPLTTFPTPTTTPRPLGCEVDGKFYSPGEEISSEIDKEIGWCYGTYCSEDGKVIPWDDFNCGSSTPLPSITAPFPTTPKTTTPRTTTPRTSTPLTTFPTPTTTPRPLGCEVDGKFYSPGEEISSEIDREIGWCYGTYCSEDGKVIPWDDFNCGSSTPLPSITAPFPTTPKTTTPRTTTPRTSTPLTTFPTPTTTPRPLGCEVDGKFYSPGEEISSEIDKEIGWCYGTYCSEDGKVIPWDDFNCGSSTPLPSITAPFPTTPKTTTPRTTTPRTSTPLTTFPTPTTTPRPLGCEVDGKFYSPGEEISSEIDKEIGWCYGTYCSEDGKVIPWDDFNCGSSTPLPSITAPFPTTPKTTTPRTTTPRTSTPLTTFPTPTTTPRPLGCEVDGKFYSPGEEISSEIDKEIGWCYGTYCSEDGKVIPWDDFNCGTSTPLPSITAPFPTTPKTTTPRTTTPRTSTPLTTFPTPTTTPRPLGCEVDGKFYSPGEEISSEIDKEIGWCYGTYCSEDGKVIPWDDFNCGSSTPLPSITAPFPTTPKTTTPRTTTPRTSTPLTTFPTPTTTPRPLGCEVDGKFYSPGEEISSEIDKEIGWCYGTYCSEDGKVIPWDDFNCGTSTPLPSITAPFPTTPKTTTPRTTMPRTSTPLTTFPPPTTTLGCEIDGKFYSPGEEISSGIDKEIGWCYGTYCSEDGYVISWDNFNCITTIIPTEASTTPEPTSTPPSPKITSSYSSTTPEEASTPPPRTTTAYTTVPRRLGCEYEGKFYAPGTEISKGSDGRGWCYGLICSYDGNITPWDDFNCSTTTSPSITASHRSPPTTTPSTARRKSTNLETITPKTTKPKSSSTPQTTKQPGCEYEGRFYFPGESFGEGTDGEGWCYGLYCDYDGNVIPWDNFNCGTSTPLPSTTAPFPITPKTTTPRTTIPRTSTQRTTTPPTSTRQSIGWCFFQGQYFENGDIISRIYHGQSWCSGWYCNDGKVDSWRDFDCPNPTTVPTSTPSSPSLQCYYQGVYYNEGEVVVSGEGSGDCEGLYCSGGVLVPYEGRDCGSTEQTNPPATVPSPKPVFPTNETTNLPVTDASKATDSTLTQPTIPSSITNPTSDSITTTKPSEPALCFHEGKYYEEGDIISRDFDGDNWCSGWICKGGRLLFVNCSDPTSSIPKEDTSSPKPVFPPTTHGPKPSRCFHEGRYYEEGDLATSGNNWCSGLICKDGKMLLWENCDVKLQSTNLPIRDTNKTTDSELSETITPTSITNPTTPSEGTTNAPDLTATSITNPTTQTKETTKPPELMMCFHEGKYYEEGDIISRDFDGDNWCSGWYCKGGRLIPVDCGNITSKEDTSSPKPVFPPITRGPESSLCFHEGRYYEEGDLSGNNWCSGLICKDGVMVLWENCEIKLESTKSSQVIQTPGTTILPKSTSKPPESTPTVPKSSTETPVTVKASPKASTKTSSIHPGTTKISPYTTKITPDIITKSPDTTAKTPVSSTNIPDTTTKVSDSTTRFPDSTTRTTDTPTKPEQTTPTQFPQTTKPEKQKCYYEGALYPPGEVTQGALRDGRCYGVICDISGVIIQWVTATCTPTEPPTAEIKNTLPGCVYRHKYYPPGRISRISDGTNWCLDVICTEEGKIVSINNMNCDKATTPKPAATTKPEENTCLYNGMTYSPGVISEGVDEDGWCYKVVCQDNGELYLWGDWHCKYSRRTTTTPLETTPSGPTTCTYNGKEYPVGEITRGNDASGWCYGVTCRNNGQIVLWGSFKCGKV